MKIKLATDRRDKTRKKLEKKHMDPAKIDELMQKHYVDPSDTSKFEPWATYKLTYDLDLEEQQNYEWFACGWLQFYDLINRSASIEHKIEFSWNRKPNGDSNEVTVLLFPGPAQPMKIFKNVDPIKEQDLVSYGFTKDPPSPTPPPPPL